MERGEIIERFLYTLLLVGCIGFCMYFDFNRVEEHLENEREPIPTEEEILAQYRRQHERLERKREKWLQQVDAVGRFYGPCGGGH